MLHILAQTAAADDLIHGKVLIALLGAVSTAAVGIISAVKLKRARASQITLSEPVPTVPVRTVNSPPSWDQFLAVRDRISSVERLIDKIFTEGSAREARLSDKIARLAEGQSALVKAEILAEQRMASIEHKLDTLLLNFSKK